MSDSVELRHASRSGIHSDNKTPVDYVRSSCRRLIKRGSVDHAASFGESADRPKKSDEHGEFCG